MKKWLYSNIGMQTLIDFRQLADRKGFSSFSEIITTGETLTSAGASEIAPGLRVRGNYSENDRFHGQRQFPRSSEPCRE